jgi:hypothetical protein
MHIKLQIMDVRVGTDIVPVGPSVFTSIIFGAHNVSVTIVRWNIFYTVGADVNFWLLWLLET